MICAHSLAVAEQELCPPEFMAKVGKKRNEPDPYHLVSNDLSRSVGKKEGKMERQSWKLMEIQSSCAATPSNRLPVDGSSSMAASALLQLLGCMSSTIDGDHFSLEAPEGTQVRVCYGCGQGIRVLPHVAPPLHDLCVVNRQYRSFKKSDGVLTVSLDWKRTATIPWSQSALKEST